MTSATPTEANDTARCDTVLLPIRLRLLKKKLKASTKSCMSGGLETAPAPRRDRALDEDEQQVDDDREQHGQRASGDELGLEAGLDGVEDRRAETAGADICRDGGQRDRRHGGDPDPGHPRRARHRQLYPPEAL